MTKSPAEVHAGEPTFGLGDPDWKARPYDGGPYSQEHYRVCGYCGSIHPEDMIALLRAGGSSLKMSTKSYKAYLTTPNPIVGQDCRSGSASGPTHERRVVGGGEPVISSHAAELTPPLTDAEIASGRYSREIRSPAPATIQQKFYLNHTDEAQWAEIIEANAARKD